MRHRANGHHFYGENATLSMIGQRTLFILALTVLAPVRFAPLALAESGVHPSAHLPAIGVVAADTPLCDDGNLVINGSFECRGGGEPPVHIETLAPGNTDLAGWEIIDPRPLPPPENELGKLEIGDRAAGWTIDWIGPTRWQAAHGKHCLDLDGGIRQTLKTEPGKTYGLRFEFAANPELGPNTVHLRVLIDDERHDFSIDSTGHDANSLGWTTKAIQFKAARKETTLTFFNVMPTAQSTGVALDHVVIADEQHKPGRCGVTETGQGPILLDTATGQSWRLTMQEGQSVWLPIPRAAESRRH
ncbi:MAG TPA: DUF642 domain-containing protein [Pirellulaceae bacterium]|nr:DUF642 domain-containing protein [Pirellulaceae bacterium]